MKKKYEVGQAVMIKQNLGSKSSMRGRGDYYYGGNPSQVPLGTKAVISRIDGTDKFLLRISDSSSSRREWWVHPDELMSAKEYERHEEKKLKERNKEISQVLEAALLEEEIIEKKGRKRLKPFEPKFNPREEFAVWMQEQFPELKQRVSKNEEYNAVKRRKKEIYAAATLACNHGIETTRACVRRMFDTGLARLDSTSNLSFNKNLVYLLGVIEQVSANLGDKKDLHYGTELVRVR